MKKLVATFLIRTQGTRATSNSGLGYNGSPPGPRRPPESSPPSPAGSSSASNHRASRLSAAARSAARFLVGFAALLALPLPAQAQSKILVSNLEQIASATAQFFRRLRRGASIHHGQQQRRLHADQCRTRDNIRFGTTRRRSPSASIRTAAARRAPAWAPSRTRPRWRPAWSRRSPTPAASLSRPPRRISW